MSSKLAKEVGIKRRNLEKTRRRRDFSEIFRTNYASFANSDGIDRFLAVKSCDLEVLVRVEAL